MSAKYRGLCNKHYQKWMKTNPPEARRNARKPPVGRFMKYVDKDGPVHPVCGQCWTWTGAKCKGYGLFGLNYGTIGAHRFSYKVYIGKIPTGLDVCHHCDNPACVNPAHLFAGTRQDNVNDMVDKDRQMKGEEHVSAKLTEEQVADILREHVPYSRTKNARALAKKHGVHRTTVKAIIARETWKHVD